jgi:HisJ family histidinol phosphate phosphatase
MKDEPLGYTYHSHTKRCGHAIGEDEDYVKMAVECHYQILGFSDHVMLPFDSQPGMRGNYSLAPGYFKSVRDLQGKYQKQLQIYLAFEAEWYYDRYASYYHDLLAKAQSIISFLASIVSMMGKGLSSTPTLPTKTKRQGCTRRISLPECGAAISSMSPILTSS